MQQIGTYNLFLSSKYRDSGTISECSFKLSKPIVAKNSTSVFTVKVNNFSLPFTWKQLNDKFNVWNFKLIRGTTTLSSITIPPGNYSIYSLLNTISALLTAECKTITGVDIELGLTYDKDTFKASFSVKNDLGTLTIIEFQNSNTRLLSMLGFSADFIFDSNTIAISDGCVNVSPSQNVYVRSGSFSQTDAFEAVSSNVEQSDIILCCPILVQPSNFLRYVSDSSDGEITISNHVIDIVNLYLTDKTDYNTVLDILLDWDIQLIIKEYAILDKDIANDMKSDINIEKLMEIKQKHLDDINKLSKKLLS